MHICQAADWSLSHFMHMVSVHLFLMSCRIVVATYLSGGPLYLGVALTPLLCGNQLINCCWGLIVWGDNFGLSIRPWNTIYKKKKKKTYSVLKKAWNVRALNFFKKPVARAWALFRAGQFLGSPCSWRPPLSIFIYYYVNVWLKLYIYPVHGWASWAFGIWCTTSFFISGNLFL